MSWTRAIRHIIKRFERRPLTELGVAVAIRDETHSSKPNGQCCGPQPLERRAYRLNATGPFYSVNGGCITCLAPQSAAPDLMGFYADPSGTHRLSHCFFKRQPHTSEEVERAILAMEVSCIENLRYGGNDPTILKRLSDMGYRHLCDECEDQSLEQTSHPPV